MKKFITVITILMFSLMSFTTVMAEETKASTGLAIDLSNVVGVMPIKSGGTDSTTVEQFKYLYGIGEVAVEDVLPIIKGGTGATTAAQARENLGLFDKTETLSRTFPVGAIYISSSSTSPATLFGGTWTQIKDRFLLAAGDEYSAGTTGGSADEVVPSHTHTVTGTAASAGAHRQSVRVTHKTNSGGYTGVSNGNNAGSAYHYGNGSSGTNSAGVHTHSVTNVSIASSGSSGVGKNMPPYMTVYMWKRTA